MPKTLIHAAAIVLAGGISLVAAAAHAATDPAAVVKHYAELAHAKYEDSLNTAKALDQAIDAFLAARGHRGIPATTAEDAADLVQRMQFDVIFCASRLPGLTWLELYHRIRRRIGAFALLSDTWDGEAAQTLGQGEGKVLTRPVADRDLDDFLGFVEVRLAAARG